MLKKYCFCCRKKEKSLSVTGEDIAFLHKRNVIIDVFDKILNSVQRKKYLMLIAIFVSGIYTVTAQKSNQKAAIEYAKSIDFNFDTAMLKPIKKPVFVWLDGVNITSKIWDIHYAKLLKGLNMNVWTVADADMINFDVRQTTEISDTSHTNMQYTLEEGKYYRLYYKITNMFKNQYLFLFEEIKDEKKLEQAKNNTEEWLVEYEQARNEQKKIIAEKVEKKKEYLMFSEANPGYLDGVWKGTFTPKKPVTLTFNGNKLILDRKFAIGKPVHWEGDFFFDKETIVVFFNRALSKKQVWYYEIEDGVLNITDAPSDIRVGSIKGKYHELR
jgi:hypothetical protein